MAGMRVAIIGGGAAGLTALRHAPKGARVTLFEKRQIGGLWCPPSPVYADLMTNLPTLSMAFPDFPFPSGTKSFPHHTAVRQYLLAYADHFQLHDRIQQKEVRRVERHGDGFLVDGDVFDAVIVASGHFSTVNYKPLRFNGQQMHSADFYSQQDFAGKNVVVLGAGASGTDIASLVAPVADVRWIHRGFADGTKPVAGVKFLPSLQMDEEGVMDDGWKCDVVVHATGFRYEFPFLSEELRPNDEGRYVPRDKIVYGMFSTVKNLAFTGLQQSIAPFYLFHYQAETAWRKFADWDLACYDQAPKFDFDNMGGDCYLYAQALTEAPLPAMAWRRELYIWCHKLRMVSPVYRSHTIDFVGDVEDANALRCDGIPLDQFSMK